MIVLHALQVPLEIIVCLATTVGGVLIARNELADWNDRKELRRQLRAAPIPASQLPARNSHCRMCNRSKLEFQTKKTDEYGRYLWQEEAALKGQPCPADCEFKVERHLHVRCGFCAAEYAMKG